MKQKNNLDGIFTVLFLLNQNNINKNAISKKERRSETR